MSVLMPALLLALAGTFLGSFLVGRYPVPPLAVLRELLATAVSWLGTGGSAVHAVVVDVRLPRIGAAVLVGAGLSLSGACYQGVFRNPLVSPFVLGVSAGAGFGAALAILFLPGLAAVRRLAVQRVALRREAQAAERLR